MGLTTNYPFPVLAAQLQFICTPADYMKIVGPYIHKWGTLSLLKYSGYWRLIPEYTYAYCPICHHQYREQADTYCLKWWEGNYQLRDALYSIAEFHPQPLSRCRHWLGITGFTNLHGQIPDELNWFKQWTGEVPAVAPMFLPDDIESYVILHALPVCRIENNQFVPRYTIFVLTYFSQKPYEILNRIYSEESDDPEYRPLVGAISKLPGPSLSEWTQRGRLGWLDVSNPDLPLRIGPNSQLPDFYQNIQGSKERFNWEKPQSPILKTYKRFVRKLSNTLEDLFSN
jgi:hypothetical protein